MSADRPHFSVGPFCGSCPESTNLHTGCLAQGTARLAENDPGRLRRLGKWPQNGSVPKSDLSKSRVIVKNPGEPVEPLVTYVGTIVDNNSVETNLGEEPEA